MSSSRNVVVGRSPSADVVIDAADVSWKHAKIFVRGDGLWIEDLGSVNGTFVNDVRVDRCKITIEDDVRFGSAMLAWSEPAMRRLLRAARRNDTLRIRTDDAQRFLCGSCGQRGIVPPAFQQGYLMCGACKTRLWVSRSGQVPSNRRWLTSALFVAAGILGTLGVLRMVAPNTLEGAARNLGFVGAQPARPIGPSERAIQQHAAERVRHAIESTQTNVRNEAVSFAAAEQGTFRAAQVASIWSNVRQRWRYVNDPKGREYFAPAHESVANGYAGDCDDFAIVLVSMIEAVGGSGRIVMMDGEHGGHAYAEACIPEESPTDVRDSLRAYRGGVADIVHYRPSGDLDCALWLNLDWNAETAGGPYERERWAVAIYPDGTTEALGVASDLEAD